MSHVQITTYFRDLREADDADHFSRMRQSTKGKRAIQNLEKRLGFKYGDIISFKQLLEIKQGTMPLPGEDQIAKNLQSNYEKDIADVKSLLKRGFLKSDEAAKEIGEIEAKFMSKDKSSGDALFVDGNKLKGKAKGVIEYRKNRAGLVSGLFSKNDRIYGRYSYWSWWWSCYYTRINGNS